MQSKMEWIELDDNLVKMYEENPRIIEPDTINAVAKSIKKFGFQQPIVLNKDNVIIVGHTRVLAAVKLGLKKIPVIKTDLSEADAKAYRIADNKLHEHGRWNYELLGYEISDLKEMDFDIDVLGFDESELQFITDGWNSNIDVSTKDGESLDPLQSLLKIEVQQDVKDKALELIKETLDKSGVEYSVK
jgi:hypothetical protein